MQQHQRLLVRSRSEPRVDRLPFRIGADQLRVDAVLDQKLLQKTRAGGLVAGRIGRVDAQVRNQRILRFAFDRIAGTAGGAAALERREQAEEKREDAERPERVHAVVLDDRTRLLVERQTVRIGEKDARCCRRCRSRSS